ncbi:MAG: carbohydrate ABC transporter permease [Clostridia bacterium]|nr:carbohydrate ABC transporter permease [Clostridia bacterium]
MTAKRTKILIIAGILAITLALVFLIPFYFVLVNSFKTYKEISVSTASLPSALNLQNYYEVFRILNYPKVFMNSLIITVTSNVGLVIISSMAAYWMARHPNKFNSLLFGLFVSSSLIPFQSIMLPMVRVAKTVGWQNNYYGILFCYLGFGVAFTLFLYHGFIKSISVEIEESASIDGCTRFGVFWKIVFPLLKPITGTVVILNSLWIWNDFLLPYLILSAPKLRTVPLAVNSFFGQYTKQWDLAMAALVMSIIPIIILFLALQRYIIAGITQGSVKG